MPPGFNIGLVLIGVMFFRRWPRLLRFTVIIAFVTLWAWCTPVVCAWLAHTLENYSAFDPNASGDAQAIVILSGGRYSDAPEYGGADTVGSDTLERVRYGAHLARQLKLPVAVTGGTVLGTSQYAIGELMARVMAEEFRMPARWIETRSRNTAQNASELRALLPVQHIILVTHAIHMKRAAEAFERVGFTVTQAPMGYASGADISYGLFDWLPSASALSLARAVLHEWIGMVYYRWRYARA